MRTEWRRSPRAHSSRRPGFGCSANAMRFATLQLYGSTVRLSSVTLPRCVLLLLALFLTSHQLGRAGSQVVASFIVVTRPVIPGNRGHRGSEACSSKPRFGLVSLIRRVAAGRRCL